ncbi:MAG: hypothetical protein L6R28_06025 [Planctomycetes bacterium]|nr:hypothetical protein [Planctomycetota bacterium]
MHEEQKPALPGAPVRLGGGVWLLMGLAGLGLVGCFYQLAGLSARFVYGQGHADRPILEFLAWMGGAFAAYAAALWVILRVERFAGVRAFGWPGAAWVVAAGFAARLALLYSSPIQEIDYARYLWDGASVVHGVSPFEFAPDEISPGENDVAYSERQLADLETLRALRTESADAERTQARIHHREVRTIYPPLAQGVFALSYLVKPWSLTALRAIFLLFELAATLLLLDTLRRLGHSAMRALVYAWSPLAIKELANSPHLDCIAVFCIALAAWAWVAGHGKTVFVALGLGVLAKTWPAVLVPAALVAIARHTGFAQAFWGLIFFLFTVSLGYAPFVAWSGERVFEGHVAFATGWAINGSLFPLSRWLAGLAVGGETQWTVGAVAMPAAELLARGVCAGIGVAVVLATALWPEREPSPRSLLGRWLAVTAALFLLAPTGNPWYATWLLPLMCVYPLRGLVLLTGLLPLHYLHFFFDYQDHCYTPEQASSEFTMVQWIEYLPVYLVLMLDWVAWRRARAKDASGGVTRGGPIRAA